jgi:CheY-like chemotaxis protein
MKIVANLQGFPFVYDVLRETGHTVAVLDDEVMLPEIPEIFARENPDLFFCDPGAPTYERFEVVKELMDMIGRPPTVFFTVMPEEWHAHCVGLYPNIRVVRAKFQESFDGVMADAMDA